MSDEFDSLKLPDELRDVAGRLRGLRPTAAKASEAECMYRAGWQAALAAHANAQTQVAPSWNGSYFGGLVSGALVSGALAAAWLLGMSKPFSQAVVMPDQGSVARGPLAPTPESLVGKDRPSQRASDEPLADERLAPADKDAVPMRTASGELVTTALLSPAAREQWRGVLIQAAAPYAAPQSQSQPSGESESRTLRSLSRDMEHSWF